MAVVVAGRVQRSEKFISGRAYGRAEALREPVPPKYRRTTPPTESLAVPAMSPLQYRSLVFATLPYLVELELIPSIIRTRQMESADMRL
jgi:hypothetical protein